MAGDGCLMLGHIANRYIKYGGNDHITVLVEIDRTNLN